MAERTTTDAGLTYTVRYPRRALLGRPIPVTVTIANHTRQTAYIAPSSQSVRAVSPALWFNHTGKTPYTPLGDRQLRQREETGRFRGPIPPGEVWSHTFDVTDYYQVPIAHEYDLHLSTTLEFDTPDAPSRLCFEVAGLLIDVKERK